MSPDKDLHSVDAGSAGVQAGVGDGVDLHEVGAWKVGAPCIPSIVPDCTHTDIRQLLLDMSQGARSSGVTMQQHRTEHHKLESGASKIGQRLRTVSSQNLQDGDDRLEGHDAWCAPADDEVERDGEESNELQSGDEPVKL